MMGREKVQAVMQSIYYGWYWKEFKESTRHKDLQLPVVSS